VQQGTQGRRAYSIAVLLEHTSLGRREAGRVPAQAGKQAVDQAQLGVPSQGMLGDSTSQQAVRRWLRERLGADRSERPYLIRGVELARFLNQKQKLQQHGRGKIFVLNAGCSTIITLASEAVRRRLSAISLVASILPLSRDFIRASIGPFAHWYRRLGLKCGSGGQQWLKLDEPECHQ
jgi:hypothetical protein